MEGFSLVFANYINIQLTALLVGVLFFAMIGFRELKSEDFTGLVYILLAMFFLCIHGYLLWDQSFENSNIQQVGFWQWSVRYLAPALIILFMVLGGVSFIMARYGAAIVKIFSGLLLVGLLFFLGVSWPIAMRGAAVLIWSGLWFRVELRAIG
jgi:hypothetical protein